MNSLLIQIMTSLKSIWEILIMTPRRDIIAWYNAYHTLSVERGKAKIWNCFVHYITRTAKTQVNLILLMSLHMGDGR